MVYDDYWSYLLEDLTKLYEHLGKADFLERDCHNLEKSYKAIERLWRKQYERIKSIDYIMLSEAPLFGEKQSYFYNEQAGQTQFFYYSDAEFLTNYPIGSKRDLISSFNDFGIIIFDVFPFAFNNDTAVKYGDFTKKNNRALFDLTYKNHFNPQLQLIAKKINPNTKVFYRYKRVKNTINDFMLPELKKIGINITKDEIPTISKRGGMVNRESLKKIFTI